MATNILKKIGLCTIFTSSFILNACSGNEASTTPPSVPSTAPAPISVSAATPADPLARGAKLFKRCQSCHSLEQEGRHKVGPNLWAIYGAKPGTKEGFKYSAAMTAMDIVWNDETLSGYLENPRKFLPGGKMSYAGLRKPEDRAAILAFLKDKTSP